MLSATQRWACRTAACHCCLTARRTRCRPAAATIPNNSLVPRNTTGCQWYARTLVACLLLCGPSEAAPPPNTLPSKCQHALVHRGTTQDRNMNQMQHKTTANLFLSTIFAHSCDTPKTATLEYSISHTS